MYSNIQYSTEREIIAQAFIGVFPGHVGSVMFNSTDIALFATTFDGAGELLDTYCYTLENGLRVKHLQSENPNVALSVFITDEINVLIQKLNSCIKELTKNAETDQFFNPAFHYWEIGSVKDAIDAIDSTVSMVSHHIRDDHIIPSMELNCEYDCGSKALISASNTFLELYMQEQVDKTDVCMTWDITVFS